MTAGSDGRATRKEHRRSKTAAGPRASKIRMTWAVLLMCLVVASPAAAADPLRTDDRGDERPRATPEYRIRDVRFAGDPAFDADALKKVLKALKGRRPTYDARAIEADLARLRSF